MKTNKGGIVKQSGNDDVEGYRSEKVLFQPNVSVFLQYSVINQRNNAENHCNKLQDRINILEQTMDNLKVASQKNDVNYLPTHTLSTPHEK